jgi:hypothetical protein
VAGRRGAGRFDAQQVVPDHLTQKLQRASLEWLGGPRLAARSAARHRREVEAYHMEDGKEYATFLVPDRREKRVEFNSSARTPTLRRRS